MVVEKHLCLCCFIYVVNEIKDNINYYVMSIAEEMA